MTIAMTVVIMMINIMTSNTMTYRIEIRIERRIKMKIVIKSLDMILLPASITSRETYELQEINKDEKEKIKKVGGRSAKRNEKLETHELRITNWTKARP